MFILLRCVSTCMNTEYEMDCNHEILPTRQIGFLYGSILSTTESQPKDNIVYYAKKGRTSRQKTKLIIPKVKVMAMY